MRLKLIAALCVGILNSAAWSDTVISKTEVSRMDIHRGGAGAPATGPTEDGYVTWFHSFGNVKTTWLSNTTIYTTYADEPLWNMCPSCGANAGYQFKIFSKQDPRVEKFDKPIVIVPGFDLDYGSTSASDFGEFSGMMSAVYDESQPGLPISPNQNLLRELYESGYDVVFIKFYNPNTDIAVNAKVLEQGMIWLNSVSSTRPGDEPAIIGASMGGLIARLMLQNAGLAQGPSGGAIKAGLFISFDSPNRGAVVPMSVQALLRYLRDENDEAGLKNENISSTAAAQMMAVRRESNITMTDNHTVANYEAPGSFHGDFMGIINNPSSIAAIKHVKSLGNSRSIRTVAIANGSDQGSAGTRGLTPGQRYASESYLTLDYDLRFSQSKAATRVMYADVGGVAGGLAPWTYNLTEPAFLENAPGGNRDSYGELMEVITRAGYGSRNYTGQRGHCFMPTASALGLTSFDINNDAGWLMSSGPTMFDEIRAPSQNQKHVTITVQNKAWIMAALRRSGPGAQSIVPGNLARLLLN